MELKELGRTGIMVPEIGLGTWKYSGGPAPLLRGIDLGANLIDTAEMYKTEDAVGQAIAGRRDEVFLATKVLGSHLRYDEVMRAVDESLRRLAVDCIDLYQIHWSNHSVPISETMGAMEELVNTGKVRFIGVSNFSTKELQEAQAAMTEHAIVSNQVLYNLNSRKIEQDLIPYCQDNRITIMAYTPLADGSLTSGPRFRQSEKSRAIDQVSAETGKTRAQVALNWCTSRPNVIAIPKSNRIDRTEENCGASGWRLSEEQIRLLDEAF
jgi:diketogulonate reductase-like aldo/keto reductase